MEFNFTAYNNQEINKKILEDLSFIKKKVLQNNFGIIRLFLVGGFGRGEGSVMYNADKIVPLNDYDFLVVIKKKSKSILRKLSALGKKLAKEIHIDFVDFMVYTPEDLEKEKNQETLFLFEAINAYYVVYQDKSFDFALPDLSIKMVSAYEMLRLLFNRAACFLESARAELEGNKIIGIVLEKNDIFYALRQLNKTIIACGDTILFLYQKYKISYVERAKELKELGFFSNKEKKTIEDAYLMKVFPDKIREVSNPFNYWKDAIKIYQKTLNYFIKKYFNLETSDTRIDQLIQRYRYNYNNPLTILIKIFVDFSQKFGNNNLFASSWPERIITWDNYRFDDVWWGMVLIIFYINPENFSFKKELEQLVEKTLRLKKPESNKNWNFYRQQALIRWNLYKH
ncbi:MAG: hypothetical protein ACFFDN_17465 [Candidatus Hodarchaeota archaeon]